MRKLVDMGIVEGIGVSQSKDDPAPTEVDDVVALDDTL